MMVTFLWHVQFWGVKQQPTHEKSLKYIGNYTYVRTMFFLVITVQKNIRSERMESVTTF